MILREEAIENYKSFKKLFMNVDTTLELNGEFGIISTLKVKKNKNTEERKMKETLSTLAETKTDYFCEKKEV